MVFLVSSRGEPRYTGLRRWPAVLAFALLACGDGRRGCTTCSPDATVVRVVVTLGTASVEEGQNVTAVARAFDASDREITGQTFAWSSSDPAVAGVANGQITALLPGTARISASAGTVTGSEDLAVTATPVGRVEVSLDSATLSVGYAGELAATTRSAAGLALAGRRITWQSSDPAVAALDSTGPSSVRVRALRSGTSHVIALSEGKADTALVRVVVPTAVQVRVTPRYLAVEAGDSATVTLSAVAANGDTVYTPAIIWSSDAAAVAGGAGMRVRGLAPGAARLAAAVDGASDTVTVAVLGPASVFSTAWPREQFNLSLRAGDTVSVPVIMDLGRRGTSGDLGAAQMSFSFPATLLEYLDTAPGSGATALVHQTQPGTLRIAYAASDPQPGARITLVVLRFRVAAAAAAGQQARLGLTHLIEPLGTTFQPLGMPVVPQGSIRIVP
jgi:hypothetical protein